MPLELWTNALIISTKTRIGAIAFSAPTNKSPKIASHDAPGATSPSIAPTASPAAIRSIRLHSL